MGEGPHECAGGLAIDAAHLNDWKSGQAVSNRSSSDAATPKTYHQNNSDVMFERWFWMVSGGRCRSPARTPRLHLAMYKPTAGAGETHVYRSGYLFSLTLSTRSRTREEVLSKGDEGIFLFFETVVSIASALRFSAGISLSLSLSCSRRSKPPVARGGGV